MRKVGVAHTPRSQKMSTHSRSVVRVGHYLLSWGGYSPDSTTYTNCNEANKLKFIEKIDVYNCLTNKWERLPTQGQPPLGVHQYASACLDDERIYYFGGYCGHDQCYHNSLHELKVGTNLKSLTWREVLPTGNDIIKRKAECGMFCFTVNQREYALVVGGKGVEGSPLSSYETTVPGKKGMVFTKECHIIDLENGDVILSQESPLSAGFQFIGITTEEPNVTRALAYGGDYKDGIHKDIHIAELQETAENEIKLVSNCIYLLLLYIMLYICL